MADSMTFPDTVEELMEQYKVVDTEQVYTNGTEFVPIYRMKQWFEHLSSVQPTYTEAEVQKMQDMEQAQLDKAFELGKESAKAEIIHCGECKHWREGTAFSYCDKLHGMGVLDALDYMTAEDEYCSMAERRTDGRD